MADEGPPPRRLAVCPEWQRLIKMRLAGRAWLKRPFNSPRGSSSLAPSAFISIDEQFDHQPAFKPLMKANQG
jgi:hypothetical protein